MPAGDISSAVKVTKSPELFRAVWEVVMLNGNPDSSSYHHHHYSRRHRRHHRRHRLHHCRYYYHHQLYSMLKTLNW